MSTGKGKYAVKQVVVAAVRGALTVTSCFKRSGPQIVGTQGGELTEGLLFKVQPKGLFCLYY